MAANRTLPYGYQMQNGEIIPHPEESRYVRSIFEQYLAGESLLALAEHFNGLGVVYNPRNPLWNKNSVKRLLENVKYTGDDRYPAIIDRQLFAQAEILRRNKACVCKCPRAAWSNILCHKCGSAMRKVSRRFLCPTENCGTQITEAMLDRLSAGKLLPLLSEPENRLESDAPNPTALSVDTPWALVAKLQPGAALDTLFQDAAKRYAACSEADRPARQTAAISSWLEGFNTEHPVLADLLPIIQQIHIGENFIQIELINGQKL